MLRIRDPVPFWPLDTGSGIVFSGYRISDPGSQTHIFESFVTIFLVKSSIILWKLGQNFFSALQNQNNFQFCEICGYIKRFDKKLFFTPLFCCCIGSGIRDPGWVKIRIQEQGSGINIPDPQHCFFSTSEDIFSWIRICILNTDLDPAAQMNTDPQHCFKNKRNLVLWSLNRLSIKREKFLCEEILRSVADPDPQHL